MNATTWRPLMCAGVLVGGLLTGGPGVAVAVADPGGRDGGGPGHSSDSGKRDSDRRPGVRRGSRADDRSGHERRRRDDRADRDRSRERGEDAETEDGKNDSDPSEFTRPFAKRYLTARVPGIARDIAGTVSDTVSDTVSGTVSLFRASEPEPEPGPTFRGGPGEEDSVADSAGGIGGGSRPLGTGAPGVLEVPVVASAPVAVGTVGGPGAPAAVAAPAPAPSAPAPSAPAPSGFFGIQATLPAVGPVGPVGAVVPPPAAPLAVAGPAPRFTIPRPGGPARDLVGALPGLAGLLLATVSGGFIGYRQASAGRYVRTEGADRYLQ